MELVDHVLALVDAGGAVEAKEAHGQGFEHGFEDVEDLGELGENEGAGAGGFEGGEEGGEFFDFARVHPFVVGEEVRGHGVQVVGAKGVEFEVGHNFHVFVDEGGVAVGELFFLETRFGHLGEDFVGVVFSEEQGVDGCFAEVHHDVGGFVGLFARGAVCENLTCSFLLFPVNFIL